MTDDNFDYSNFMFVPVKDITLEWSWIKPSKMNERRMYKVLIYNCTNYHIIKPCQSQYLIFKTKLIDGFDYLKTDNKFGLDLVYDFHFPAHGFHNAWRRYHDDETIKIEKGTSYDCLLTFERASNKSILFHFRRLHEVGTISKDMLNEFKGDMK